MNRISSTLFLALVLLSGSSSVNAATKMDTLVDDMVILDRHYIAALALTSQQKVKPASQAMARLLPLWKSFNNEHRDMAMKDANWKKDMDKIDHYIHAANKIVSSGKKLTDAHEELEHVRIIMMSARERNHIDYFIDHLTRFHEPMEALVLTVKGKSASDISSEIISKMKSEIKTAKILWNKVTHASLDQNSFGFSDARKKMVLDLKNKETAALAKLDSALAGSDKNAIIKSGLAIKPPFAKMFMLFGALEQAAN